MSAVLPDEPANQEPASFGVYREALLRFVQARVGDREIAEDLVQDTLLKASRCLPGLKSPDAFPAWLFQIARHRVADHFRAARDTEEFDEARHGGEASPKPSIEPLDAGLIAYIRSAVEGLPAIYRDALLATEYGGVSQAEFARSAGLSAPAAKSRVQRARALLRAEMERCCHWEADKYGQILDVIPRAGGCAQK